MQMGREPGGRCAWGAAWGVGWEVYRRERKDRWVAGLSILRETGGGFGPSTSDRSGISKPMVCQTYGLGAVAFHANDGKHENDENDEDNSDSCKHWELSAGFAEITETTKMTKTTRIQCAKHGFPKPRV